MPSTTDYINQLKKDKQNLANNLVSKGIDASEEETFTSLVPKVLNIEVGTGGGIDTSDATATADDIIKDKTAYVNGEKLTGILEVGLTKTEYDGCLNLSERILPFRSYDYIQSTGTQFIDTGIKVTGKKIRYEIKAKNLRPYRQAYSIFGCYNSNGYNGGTLHYNKTSWGLYGRSGNPLVENVFPTSTLTELEGYFEVGENEYSYSFNDIYKGSGVASGLFASDINIALFTQNAPYGYDTYGTAMMKLYYFKIYIDDELVLDVVPSKDANSVICLYDKVSKTYLYNKGSRTFSGGDD